VLHALDTLDEEFDHVAILQHGGDLFEIFGRNHAAGGILRRIEDQQPRTRRDLIGELLWIEAEVARLAQINRHPHRTVGFDLRFVDRKPGIGEDHFVAGTVIGIRFYKAATNGGTHVGTLWNASGTQLAQASFSGESPSGWQQVKFTTPIQIQANTTYVAGYLAPQGHYSVNGPTLEPTPEGVTAALTPLVGLPGLGSHSGISVVDVASTAELPTQVMLVARELVAA